MLARIIPILLTLTTPVATTAQQITIDPNWVLLGFQPEDVGCPRSDDWSCAFDALLGAFDEPHEVEICLKSSEIGCVFERILVQEVAVKAAYGEEAAVRRGIAERAFKVDNLLSEGLSGSVGEYVYSSMRFDSCRTLGDEPCVLESVVLLKRASLNLGDERDYLMDSYTASLGEEYVVFMKQVFTDVERMELDP
jgi:hypothetical protein